MTDEKQEPPKAAEGAGTPAQKPATEGGGASPQATPDAGAASKPPAPAGAGGGAPGAPAKPPAAAPPKPPATPAKAPVKPEPWSSPLLDELQKRFPGAISEAVIFRNMPSLNVVKEQVVAVCEFLKSGEGGAYSLLTDETAVDYPKREKRFDIIYHLYSFRRNDRLRLRVQVGEGENVPSVTGVWPTANWLEREIYDMFGVVYEGHPDLKRILMPDGWVGHPLRKDYDILKQDDAWVKANLGIESAQ
ncbi:MAG: NADH-quinone oxidoreductase subunit C [Terriglobia bacterium]|jgi:NADH-quinone oxidoreductase subunit C